MCVRVPLFLPFLATVVCLFSFLPFPLRFQQRLPRPLSISPSLNAVAPLSATTMQRPADGCARTFGCYAFATVARSRIRTITRRPSPRPHPVPSPTTQGEKSPPNRSDRARDDSARTFPLLHCTDLCLTAGLSTDGQMGARYYERKRYCDDMIIIFHQEGLKVLVYAPLFSVRFSAPKPNGQSSQRGGDDDDDEAGIDEHLAQNHSPSGTSKIP